MDAPSIALDNPFAVLTFLAAPAILTNASTLLVLSTSNRLARAADRARGASAVILSSGGNDAATAAQQRDFNNAATRTEMLVSGLARFYLATGAFAGGTCVALLGAFAGYFQLAWVPVISQVLTAVLVLLGVGALVSGSTVLLAETRLALRGLGELHASITQWRATHAQDQRA